MASEPRWTTLLAENDRARLWDLTVPPGETAEFYHACSCLRWQVGHGDCEHVDGSDAAAWSQAGTAASGRRNETHADRAVLWLEQTDPQMSVLWKIRNVGPANFRQAVLEFIEPRPKYSGEEVRALLDAAVFSTDVGTALLFENERCRVWDFSFGPGEGDPAAIHQHVLDYIFWFPCGGTQGLGSAKCRLLGYNPDGTQQFDSQAVDGEFIWQPVENGGFLADGTTVNPDHRHGGKNGFDDKPFVEYLVEMK